MRKRPLGQTGIDVSVLCLGTMTFGWSADEPTSFAIMNEALERGINFFDTADIYTIWSPASYAGKTEEFIGRWLAEDPSRRGRIVLATKVRGPMSDRPEDQGLGKSHIIASIEGSLRRLKTDHIDLYQSHWFDAAAQQEETLRAYDDLIRSGKVRAIGCSNYSASELRDATAISKQQKLARYESLQPEYSLLQRDAFERETRAICLEQKIGVIPYSPLAGGFLGGKYRRGEGAPSGTRGEQSAKIKRYMSDPKSYDLLDKLAEIATNRKSTIASIALSWVTDAPAITSSILGANSVSQLRESVDAATIELTPDERASLDTITRSS